MANLITRMLLLTTPNWIQNTGIVGVSLFNAINPLMYIFPPFHQIVILGTLFAIFYFAVIDKKNTTGQRIWKSLLFSWIIATSFFFLINLIVLFVAKQILV